MSQNFALLKVVFFFARRGMNIKNKHTHTLRCILYHQRENKIGFQEINLFTYFYYDFLEQKQIYIYMKKLAFDPSIYEYMCTLHSESI